MSEGLIIVESPAKARTISRFVKDKYQVIASMGHVKDLPKSKLGVDIENNFQPHYINIRGKGPIIKELKQAAKKHSLIYLAPDPDREGEAIAWHLATLLGEDKVVRVYLYEITSQALKSALNSPSKIDKHKVNAQQARRVLDRLVGYKISPLLWRKVQRGLSAGRVQSVAVRLICEREKQIQDFKSKEYWTISGDFTPEEKEFPFKAQLAKKDQEKITIPDEKTALKIVKEIKRLPFYVKDIIQKEQQKNPSPPFITSTLQQEAFKKLGFRAARTMRTAQQLYEGLDLGSKGEIGLITYMRTDSTRVSESAKVKARSFIEKIFGKEFIGPDRKYKIKPTAQEAHEAIRPTVITNTPEDIRKYLNSDQYKLYQLIWKRFLASQMANCILDTKSIDIEAGAYLFRATGQSVKFPGFIKLYEETPDESTAEQKVSETRLPILEKNQLLKLISLEHLQHFTQPPPRYTEATLIKTLEENGIGRPSTYAPTVDTIQKRGYIYLENRRLIPTKLGNIINDLLVEHFSDIVDVDFTAKMEEDLDKIETGQINWMETLKDFYSEFSKVLSEADKNIEKIEIEPEKTDEVCDLCEKPMVVKRSRYGKFLACSAYPECKNTKSFVKKIGVPCPEEGCSGEIIERHSKKGKFYGCSRYPECKFISRYKPTDKRCPVCNRAMVLRFNKAGDSYLRCIDSKCGKKKP